MNDSPTGISPAPLPKEGADHRAEEALRRSEARYRALVEATSQAVWSWAPGDGDDDFSRSQRWWAQLTGQSPDDQRSTPNAWLDVVHPDDREAAATAWQTAISSGTAYEVEYRVKGRQGGWRYIQARGVPISGPDGTVREWVGTLDDVTDRRTTDHARREGEARFRGLMEQAPFSVQVFAPDGRTLGVNRAWEELWGLTLEQLGDYNLLCDPQLDAKGITPYLRRAAAGEVVAIPAIRYDPEETIPGRTRHAVPHRWVSAVAYPLKDTAGRVREVVLVHEDITGRMHAEEAMRRNEAWLQTVTDSLPALVSYIDRDLRYRFVNRAYEEWFGLPVAAIVGRSIAELLGDESFRLRRAGIERALAGERVRFEAPIEHRTLGGRVTEMTYTPHTEGSRVVGFFVHVHDVTERVRAETERANLAETLSLALGAADLGTWDWDPRTDQITLSARAAEIYGLAPEGTYTRKWMRALIRPDYRRVSQEAAARSIDQRGEYDVEYPLERGVWVAARGRGVYDAAGTLTRMLGVVQDVTDRKRGEEALLRSEERHRVLVTATSDVVYRMSADWSVMQPLDGRGLVASTTEPTRDWIHTNVPDFEHPRVWSAINSAIASKSTFELEHRVNRADGTHGWAFSRAVPILDAAGAIVEWFGTARDVTAHKQAEEEIARVTAESERRKRLYETVLSSTPDFVYVFSLDHRVLYANDALLAMWGRGYDGAIGKTFLEIGYEPWHAEMHDREIDQVRTTKQPIRGELPFNGTLGRRMYDYIFVPVLGADGEVEAVAGTTRDVTERKGMEDDLREADRKKDEFIALLAHELRNPLAPIRNGLQVIRLSQDRVIRERSQAMMDRQLAHMVRLIDDLLDVSRISRNKMELRRARITLSEIVSSAVETAGPAMEEAGHELTVTLPPRPVFLDADLTRLAQVLSNLLANSAKYTPRGGRIVLTAEQADGTVVISVRDTGIGIPPVSLPAIFDMFSQVDRSIERSSGGLGIGLALVKGLVEMHGGTVSASSEGPGQGSTFTVTLPAVASRSGAGSPTPDSSHPATGPKHRILVVDDNRDGAESLSEMLRLRGNEVGMAHDGVEAVEQAERFRPDVILMDIGMPRMNGLDATRRIRELPWGKPITIVALTGWGQQSDRDQSRDAGCNGHLVKPVHLPDLEKMLDELLPDRRGCD